MVITRRIRLQFDKHNANERNSCVCSIFQLLPNVPFISISTKYLIFLHVFRIVFSLFLVRVHECGNRSFVCHPKIKHSNRQVNCSTTMTWKRNCAHRKIEQCLRNQNRHWTELISQHQLIFKSHSQQPQRQQNVLFGVTIHRHTHAGCFAWALGDRWHTASHAAAASPAAQHTMLLRQRVKNIYCDSLTNAIFQSNDVDDHSFNFKIENWISELLGYVSELERVEYGIVSIIVIWNRCCNWFE